MCCFCASHWGDGPAAAQSHHDHLCQGGTLLGSNMCHGIALQLSRSHEKATWLSLCSPVDSVFVKISGQDGAARIVLATCCISLMQSASQCKC